MQHIKRRFSTKLILEKMDSWAILFGYPLPRKTCQWDSTQRSLLIHSILQDYVIPPVYGIKLYSNDDYSFSVLDGKQRLTTIYDYVHDKFRLMDDMPIVTVRKRHVVTDDNGNKSGKFVNHEYDISNKKFSELDETLKEIIKDFSLTVVLLSDFTDEELKSQFFRLNNGTSYKNVKEIYSQFRASIQ